MQRAIAYIDGFNLYFGLKEANWKKYYWLNVHKLAQQLLGAKSRLIITKYFSSRVSATSRDPHKQARQSCFLDAMKTLPDVQLFMGHYLKKPQQCRHCHARWNIYEEKMTDVNIAVEMLTDAFQDNFDSALLISADSDLTSPIAAIRGLFPHKSIVVAFPPGRRSWQLRTVATSTTTIGRPALEKSLFPDEIVLPSGFHLHRPDSWR